MIYLAIAIIAVGAYAMIMLMDEAIDIAETAPYEPERGYGIDLTDRMAAEYRYEQAQRHA